MFLSRCVVAYTVHLPCSNVMAAVAHALAIETEHINYQGMAHLDQVERVQLDRVLWFNGNLSYVVSSAPSACMPNVSLKLPPVGEYKLGVQHIRAVMSLKLYIWQSLACCKLLAVPLASFVYEAVHSYA